MAIHLGLCQTHETVSYLPYDCSKIGDLRYPQSFSSQPIEVLQPFLHEPFEAFIAFLHKIDEPSLFLRIAMRIEQIEG